LELERLLCDVQRIKQNLPAQMPEFLGFATWKDVMSASLQPEGEHLRALVNLVQEHGEKRILAALARCEQHESSAEVVCSTAHKAKGREWHHVHLDKDFETGFARAGKSQDRSSYEAEARLLYVAITRARIAVHLPRDVAKRFGISKTTEKLLET
jgi:superfamily I DNA/RNA helicase